MIVFEFVQYSSVLSCGREEIKVEHPSLRIADLILKSRKHAKVRHFNISSISHQIPKICHYVEDPATHCCSPGCRTKIPVYTFM